MTVYEVNTMKMTLHRSLSVLLAVALAVSLAVPALAARVRDITLDQDSVTLVLGADTTTRLTYTISPSDADDQSVTWSTSKSSVVTVSSSGVLTPRAVGTATITVATGDGDYRDTCKVTVVENYVTDVTITTKDAGALSVGETRTLSAEVTYKHDDGSSRGVTWESTDTSVATVSSKGKVTAVAPGTVSIVARAKDDGNNGTSVTDVYKLTVTDDRISMSPSTLSLSVGGSYALSYSLREASAKTAVWVSDDPAIARVSDKGVVTGVRAGSTTVSVTLGTLTATCKVTVTDPGKDGLSLAAQNVVAYGGQYLKKTLTAPVATVKNGSQDVTKDYDLSYRWTDAKGTLLSTKSTLDYTPTTLDAQKLTCQVIAVDRSDQTRYLSEVCSFALTVLPSTQVSASIDASGGAKALVSLKDAESGLTVLEQLSKGVSGSSVTPAISGLSYLIFDLDTAAETVGALSAKGGVAYYTSDTNSSRLSAVTFTPKTGGAYTVGFLAYGDKTYYGELELTVTGSSVTPVDPVAPVTPTDPTGLARTCDASGFTFAGSDLFRSSDTDPVESVVFGAPTSGTLLRGLDRGLSVKSAIEKDSGARYYTDSAANGTHHVSTLSFLPKAGTSGQVTIPMTVTTRSGASYVRSLVVTVTKKDASTRFSDVTASGVGPWAADSVDFVYGQGLMSGVDATSFAPNAAMTRGMLVTVLYRASGSPSVSASSGFRDVKSDAYYASAVAWAAARGIANGVSETKFDPDAPVTREQIATILYRYARANGEQPSAVGSLAAFTDQSSVSPYAVSAMTWAVQRGIISGTTAKTLSPLDKATRAQMTVMLHRYLTDI